MSSITNLQIYHFFNEHNENIDYWIKNFVGRSLNLVFFGPPFIYLKSFNTLSRTPASFPILLLMAGIKVTAIFTFSEGVLNDLLRP